MKLTRMAIALMLLMSLFTCSAFAAVTMPTDIAGHWAKEGIEDFVTKGYMGGYADGTFKPDAQITRAEFMKIINAAYGFTEKVEITYTDVPADAWFYAEVAKAKAAGYIGGYEDNSIRPNAPITRQEAAVIFFKLKKLTADEATADTFADKADIAAWAKGAVGAVVKAGVMKGYPENTFMPGKFLTRAEAVTVARGSLTLALAEAEVPLGAPVVPAATGGGGGGRNGGRTVDGGGTTEQTILTTSISATVLGKTITGTIDGDTATLKMPVSGALSAVKIAGSDGVTLTIKTAKGTNTKTLTKNMTFDDMHEIAVADIFQNDGNPSIDVTSLKAAFGNSNEIVLTGTLTKSGYTTRNVTLTLDLSDTISRYSNEYFEADTSGTTITVKIKQPDALISTISLKEMILGVSESASILPKSAEVGGESFLGLLGTDTQNAIRDKIGTICGAWATAKLSDLEAKSDTLNMQLNDIGGETYTIIFTHL